MKIENAVKMGITYPLANYSFDGTWQNELGSILKIQTADNIISGTYNTAVGNPPVFQSFNITGYISGDLISWCVDFNGYGSIGSWVGHLTTIDRSNSVKVAFQYIISF